MAPLNSLIIQSPTTRPLVDVSGTPFVAQRFTRDAWGRVLAFEDAAGLGAGYLSFGYAAGLLDSATGLVHFGAREYDPHTGRWLSPDPIGFAGGDANLYGYVLANPVMFVDPEGLCYWDLNISIGSFSIGLQYDPETGLVRPTFGFGYSSAPASVSLTYSNQQSKEGFYTGISAYVPPLGLGGQSGTGTGGPFNEFGVGFPFNGAASGILVGEPLRNPDLPSAGSTYPGHPGF